MICSYHRAFFSAIFVLFGVIVDLTFLSQARIINPTEKELFLAEGDYLRIVCEEGRDLVSQQPSGHSTASRQRHVPLQWTRRRFDEPRYPASMSLDAEGFYTTAVRTEPSGREIRELWKQSVTVSDTGEYRCQNSVTPSDHINVTVIRMLVHNATVVKINEDARLQCFPTELTPDAWNVTWFREKMIVDTIPKKYTVGVENGTLVVHRVGEKDVGEYTCELKLTDRTMIKRMHLFAYPYVKSFDKSRNVRQGSNLLLHCNAWGWPVPLVRWYRDGKPLNESDDRRLSFVNKTIPPYSQLLLEAVDFGDRAKYTCTAASSRYPGVLGNSTVLVRVKGRLAALWPFLGLCAEAILMSIIIFVYERNRKKKKQADDLNNDSGRHQANCTTSGNADSMRHRR